jgi:uncharacterized membrane protein YozB (DUF420 family)
MHTLSPRHWRLPAFLIALSLVPFAATAHRLLWLADAGRAADPAMDRYGGDWSVLLAHILSGAVFLLLAALQFSPALRARRPGWHRSAGRIAMLAGGLAGVSGVWLILGFPPGALATGVQAAVRAGFGAALAVSILLAWSAIRAGDAARHRAWMIRAVAIASAGTSQALLIGLWLFAAGPLTPASATLMITLGFVLNIAVAEACLRRPARRP